MSNKLMGSIGNYFLFQKAEEVTRGTDILDLILINREELGANLKVEGNLDESDHNMIDLMILRKGRCESNQIWPVDFKKVDINKHRKLVGKKI